MGKKKGGAHGIKDGMYNFENDVEIYFFADLEGNMPNEIEKLININDEKLININDDESGTQIKLNKNRAIVFTGDLIDRGEKSIRNLKNMLKLKTENETRVVLTCGNRDLNKIRCYQEFAVYAIEYILMQKNIYSLGTPAEIFIYIINRYYNLGNFKFKYSAEHIEQYVNLKGVWLHYGKNQEGPPAKHEDQLMNFAKNYTNDLKERVAYIYANTFGSPKQVDFFKEEFEELFRIYLYYSKTNNAIKKEENKLDKKGFYDEYIHLFIITMNMIMGKRWDNDNNNNNNIGNRLIDVFDDYKGLYIRYLEKCHIMSKITIGNKLIITSHSGIPYDDTNNRFIIPRDIGKSSADDSKEIDVDNILELNKEFNDFITKFSSLYEEDWLDKKYVEQNKEGYQRYIKRYIYNKDNEKNKIEDNIKKYIAMTGHCDPECNKNMTNAKYSSLLSPVVGIHSLNDRGPLKYRGKPIILDRKYDEYNKIYHIFGHQPTGLLPSFSTAKNEQNEQNAQITYHIDLDISKAEDIGGTSNSKSYAYLKITKDEHRFVGKTNARNKIIYNLKEKEEKTEEISLDYDISLDDYDIKYETYTYKVTKEDIILHSTDKKTYYGMCSQNFQLLKYEEIKNGGRSNKYKKSEKRFINGKRKMVIYTGKRGGEYVKVKGVFISLAKYKKIISNKAAKKTK